MVSAARVEIAGSPRGSKPIRLGRRVRFMTAVPLRRLLEPGLDPRRRLPLAGQRVVEVPGGL
jgi:hypothetical protein